MIRRAVFGFPAHGGGEPQCRLVLERQRYEEGTSRTAAWLMCNPSRASHLIDDPTAGRVVHHSWRAGCGRSLMGNIWAWRTPYPVDLWPALADGRYTEAMHLANLESLEMIGAQADIHVVAFGTAGRRYSRFVEQALDAFTNGGAHRLYCLGTTDDGQPLHPLARGKFAVRNDAELKVWRA